jgi:hypothetical protein
MLTRLFYGAHGDDEHSRIQAQQCWGGADLVTGASKELRSI